MPDPSPHPDPGLLAAHAERRLTGAEAARLDDHLVRCADCYEVFAETVRYGLEQSDDVVPERKLVRPFFPRPAFLLAGLAAAACVVLAVVVWRQSRQAVAGPLAELVQAVGEQRFVEPRLTGGFRYGRFVRLRSGEESHGLDAQPPAVIVAVARIRERAETDTSPAALQALAATYLVSGDPSSAVRALESATAQKPDDARLQSDLAAAYLVRAERMDEPADIPKGLEAAEKAIALGQPPAEAWFNRALALEDLHLTDEARKAWEDYLKRDSTSAWAGEASRRLAALPAGHQSSIEEERAWLRAAIDNDPGAVDRLANETPWFLRCYFDDDLLPAWAEARLAGTDGARFLRDRAVRIGDALLRSTHDAMPRDAAAALEAVPTAAGRDPPRTQALGYRSLRAAQRLFDDQQGACEAFSEARRILSAGGSPYAAWARERVVVACDYPTRPEPALAELSRLETVALQRGYLRLLGRLRWMQALFGTAQGGQAASLEQYRQARTILHGLGDGESEAFLTTALAEDLQMLGEDRLAWRERRAGLALSGRVQDPRRRHAILEEVANVSLAERLPWTALHVQTALVDEDLAWGNPTAVSDALTRRSAILQALGSGERAAADLAVARRWIQQIGDGAIVQAATADADAAEGELAVSRRPEAAGEPLGRALGYYQRAARARVPGLHQLVARAQAALGHDEAAEAELLAGIRLLETERLTLRDAALQASFFEQATPLFDDMVVSLVDRRHDPTTALSFVERGRVRQLSDSLAAPRPVAVGEGVADGAASNVAALQRALPEGVALVYYVCLRDRLFAWLLTREGVRFAEQPSSEDQLGRLVAAQEAALQRRAPLAAVREAGGRLYDALVRPLAPVPGSTRALVFVPDAPVHRVAFAALWNRTAGRYLCEDYVVGLSPSGLLVGGSGSAGLSARPRALIVGNPRFDTRVWGGRAALPGAEREAVEVAALYDRPELLTGKEATRAAFLRALRTSDVVHYAGHGSAATDDPAGARLLLAADPRAGDSGALSLRDLGEAPARVRVVVLAACRSAAGPVSRVEGALGLSRPFLAAGVPNVVGSLWDVDDEVSRSFFVAFHRALLAGGGAPQALHRAQLSLLKDADPNRSHPASWAGFVCMGGFRLEGPPH